MTGSSASPSIIAPSRSILRGTPLLVAITVAAGFGWILFGVDNGSLGGVIQGKQFTRYYPLNSELQGTVTGVFELGAMLGAAIISIFGEKLPRRGWLWFGTVFVTIGGVLQVTSFQLAQLIVGRIVSGVGLGIVSSTLPIWQSETSSARIRGTVVCASLSFLIVGQLIAYWVDYGMNKYDNSAAWRFPFSLQIVFAAIMSVLVCFCPESPRYLIANGRLEEAKRVLADLSALDVHDAIVDGQAEEIQHAIRLERASAAKWSDLFRKGGAQNGEKRRMFTSITIQVCQAFSGSTVISYYVTPIFENSVGFEPNLAGLMSGFLQIWFLFASFLTWYLIERAGRRTLFITMAFAMAVVMFVLAGMVKLDTHASGIVAAVMIFLYQAFFTWGWMAGVWIYSTEINPLAWRTKGVGLAVALQWLWDFVLLQVTPIGIANIGWKMYIIFGLFNLGFIPFVYFFCPETAGIPLEAIDLLYAPGVNPVKESKRLRRAHAERARRGFPEGKFGEIKDDIEALDGLSQRQQQVQQQQMRTKEEL